MARHYRHVSIALMHHKSFSVNFAGPYSLIILLLDFIVFYTAVIIKI